MPQERYDADRESLAALLTTTAPHIVVPEWQRSYSWTTAEVETFWTDLLAFSRRYPADNITGQEYFLGSIVLVTGGANNLLLDGQQRLATATILLSVLRDELRNHNRDTAGRTHNRFISDVDDATGKTTFQLTMNDYDREFFRAEVQTYPANGRPRPTLRSHGLIRKARQYCEERVVEARAEHANNEATFQWALRVQDVLLNHMSVVAVKSTDPDNAAAVFETLNDRGIGLSTPDLLRNLLLRRANQGHRDRIVAAWQTVLGIEEEKASVDDFLRHYWVSYRGDVKGRKLYREIKDRVSDEDIDSLTFSLDLAQVAPVYRDLVLSRDDDEEMRRHLEAVRALGAKQLYPVLLSGCSRADEDYEKLRALASALVTMFVRSAVIGGREAGAIETNLSMTAKQLRDTGDFDAAVASLYAFAPSAEDFVAQFGRASVSRHTTARYLLREIEHAKRATEEDTVAGPVRVHLEHIYPQQPASDRWPNHAAVINRLGNLTLLGRSFNTSVKNAEFAYKKEHAYTNSRILMTEELLSYEHWTPITVDERQRELANWAFRVWRFPGENAVPEVKMAPEPADGAEPAPDELPEVPMG